MTLETLARVLHDARIAFIDRHGYGNATSSGPWRDDPKGSQARYQEGQRAVIAAVVLALAEDMQMSRGGDFWDSDRITAAQRLDDLIAEARQVCHDPAVAGRE